MANIITVSDLVEFLTQCWPYSRRPPSCLSCMVPWGGVWQEG